MEDNKERLVTPPKTLPQGNENKLEHNKYCYGLVNKWIENADNKVSVSCGIFTALFGALTLLTEYLNKDRNSLVISECWRAIYKISFIGSVVGLLLAFYYYEKAIIPNLKSNNEKKEGKGYPVFYGDIASMEYSEYKQRIIQSDINELCTELIAETWTNSTICLRKMKNYKTGVRFSMIAVGCALISMVACLLMYK